MSLLLDDDDTGVAPQPPVQVRKTETGTTADGSAAAETEPTEVFRVNGGNGLDKMSALAFGTKRVRVDTSKSSDSAARTPVRQQQSRIKPASLASPAAPAAASVATPSTDAGSTTQKKVLSPASPAAQRVSNDDNTSTNTGCITARALVVEDDSAEEIPVSVSVHSSSSLSTSSQCAEKTTLGAPKASPKQTNLMDFFSKMKCKK